MTNHCDGKSSDDNRGPVTEQEGSNSAVPEAEMSWEEWERDYEKRQLRNFIARIGPRRARLLGSTQVNSYKTPSSNYRWATRRK